MLLPRVDMNFYIYDFLQCLATSNPTAWDFFYKYVFFFSFFKQNHRVGRNPYINFFPNI